MNRVDITRLMSAGARQLVVDAAQRASEWGSADLDTDHLLWGGVAARAAAGAAPPLGRGSGRGRPQLDRAPTGESRPLVAISLMPASKRALLDAHQIARAGGATYIGPEHILMALALNPESAAGRALQAGRIGPQALRAAAAAERGTLSGDTGTPNVDRFGQDLTARAREGRVDPVIGRAEEVEQAVEVLSRRTKQPGPDRRGRRRQDGDRGGPGPADRGG